MAEVRDPAALQGAIAAEGRTLAWLGQRVGRSKQFLSMLANGDRLRCADEAARDIEEALSVRPGSLFVLTDLPEGQGHPSSQDLASSQPMVGARTKKAS